MELGHGPYGRLGAATAKHEMTYLELGLRRTVQQRSSKRPNRRARMSVVELRFELDAGT
jgi:hypothetical protein